MVSEKEIDAACEVLHGDRKMGLGDAREARLLARRALEAAEQAREVPAMPRFEVTREEWDAVFCTGNAGSGKFARLNAILAQRQQPVAMPTREELQEGWDSFCGSAVEWATELLAQRQQPPQAVWTREVADAFYEILGPPDADGKGPSRQAVHSAGLKIFGSVCPSVPQYAPASAMMYALRSVLPSAQKSGAEWDECLESQLRTAKASADEEHGVRVGVEFDLAKAERERDTALRDLAEAREQLELKRIFVNEAHECQLAAELLRDEAREQLAAANDAYAKLLPRYNLENAQLRDVREQLAAKEAELAEFRQRVSFASDNWGTWDGYRFSAELRKLLADTAEPAPQPVKRNTLGAAMDMGRAAFSDEPEPQPVEPAKPQVTLEARKLPTIRELTASWVDYCEAMYRGSRTSDVGYAVDWVLTRVFPALDTDHAEAGKGDM